MHPMRLPLLLLLASPIAAQTAAAPRTAFPSIAIETFGPDGWRTRLGPTNLGSMLESAEGKKLWQPYAESMFGVWRQLAGGEEPFAAAKARATAYGGRIRIGMWIAPRGIFAGPGETNAIAAVLEPDGRSDLQAIAKDLSTAIEHGMPGQWATLADGAETRRYRTDGNMYITEPFLANGALLCVFAPNEGLADAIAYAHSLAVMTPLAASPMAPAITTRIDVPALISGILGEAGEGERKAMQALGLGSLGVGTFAITTAGPSIAAHITQQFTSDERGIFAGLMPASPSVPSLLAARPTEGFWTVGHLDLQKIYDTALIAITADGHEEIDKVKADIHEECGIDPSADLLAHLTDEVLLWLPPTEDAEESPSRTNWAIAFRTRDDAAFKKGLYAMMPKAKPFLSREATEQYGDIEMIRYGSMISYDAWLGVGNGVFALAGGRDAQSRLEQLFDLCGKAKKAAIAEPALPADFAPLKRHLPHGLHGFASGAVDQVAQIPNILFADMIGFYSGIDKPRLSPDEAGELHDAMQKMLKEHQLETARSASGFADRTWHWRFYW